MKKYQILIVAILLAFMGCESVMAAPASTIREIEPDEELFVGKINEFLENSFYTASVSYEDEIIDTEQKVEKLASDELYTTNSYKIYADIPLFYSVDSISRDVMDSMIRDAQYIYDSDIQGFRNFRGPV